jgi:ABC-2 type transport system permease protein
MWRAIVWAQFRILRNRFPRTGFGSVLMAFVSLLWQGLFAGFGVFLAVSIPGLSLPFLEQWLPAGLLLAFLYWQTVPLLTLSAGWSLQLGKLQIYPVSHDALFGIEVLLRLSSSPEVILVLTGALIGLARHTSVPTVAPFCLLLFIPFNLLLQLAVRDFVGYAFDRSRFRELFSVLAIAIGVVPQLLLRTGVAYKLKPQLLFLSHGAAAPWGEVAALSLGHFAPLSLAPLAVWTLLAYVLARTQFRRGLVREDRFRGGSVSTKQRARSGALPGLLSRFFPDPMAALVQRELQSLARMPRFRVVFGMACIFGVLVFIPAALRDGARGGSGFMSDNFLPIVNLYGLLLLSDVLLLNVFGLDRQAAQLFFAAPVRLETVLRAKNVAALCFVALETVGVLIFVLLLRIHLSPFSVAGGIAISVVVSIFLVSAGNFTSVSMPRPIDPSSTFRKQAGSRMQLWLLFSSLGMLVLVAFPFLARWAFEKDWPFFAVLLVELGIGAVFYKVALDSAVERGMRDRERIVQALSKGASVMDLGGN